MRTRMSFLYTIMVGAALGALIGVFHIWQLDHSLRSMVASVFGGSVAGSILGAYLHSGQRRSELTTAAVGIGSGAAGGVAWWLTMGSTTSLPLAVGIGAGVVAVFLIAYKLDLPI